MREVDRELFNAVEQGNLGKVQECLEKGANVNVENNYGKTPLDYARESGHTEIVNILGSAENKSQLSKTTRGTDEKPESGLSSVTVKNQQRSPWHR
ncbi:MAG: ankyrin repeat domain-containing protein [Wolbachia sp.]